MKKRVLLIDTTSTDIDEETQCKNWKSMLDNFSSYEIRFIAALEPNTDMPIVKYVYLRNSTIYAPDSFFQSGVWKNCFPFYTIAPFHHEFIS